ncbi:MAG: helix-turn-helix domain-containing protein [Acidobacteriaceae bacterium]
MALIDDYVLDTLMRDLVGHDRRPVSFLVYLWLTAEQARHGRAIQVSFQELAESVGVSKSAAQAAVRWLERRRLLITAKANATSVPCYTVMTPWRDAAKRAGCRVRR